VQPARGLKHGKAGPNIQVVRISKDDLDAQLVKLPRGHRLHRSLRADRHEHRCFHRPVRGPQTPAACHGSGIDRVYRKRANPSRSRFPGLSFHCLHGGGD